MYVHRLLNYSRLCARVSWAGCAGTGEGTQPATFLVAVECYGLYDVEKRGNPWYFEDEFPDET